MQDANPGGGRNFSSPWLLIKEVSKLLSLSCFQRLRSLGNCLTFIRSYPRLPLFLNVPTQSFKPPIKLASVYKERFSSR
ncbi:hypothetical protein N7492_005642 [Penicillium capsulatum]|uniref:Uncharacterized protein n=1 Tax=Penicillium capsulatum TaxID=69766 RepID=A0A9W9LR79_9EURO|nr:hypothetical protein N7492_005642 [Penicillium capsulatum]